MKAMAAAVDEADRTGSDGGVAHAPGTRGARVVELTGRSPGRVVVVDRAVVFGRSSACEVPLMDGLVSRRHAELSYAPDTGYVIRDLGSRNGTLVRGEPITQTVVAFGDRFQIGSSLFLFTSHDPLEEEAFRRDRLEAVGRLGTGLARDFHGLLAALGTGLDVLEHVPSTATLDEPIVKDTLDDLRAAVVRAREVTRRIFAFAPQGRVVREPVALDTMVAAAVEQVKGAYGEGLTLSSHLEPHVLVHGDSVLLHQAVVALCRNAQEAMPRGGLLSITARVARDDDFDRLPTHPAEPFATIIVSDQGVGMSKEVRRLAFDPFFSTRTGDATSGLGLSLVHAVVSQMGGFVSLESELGKGTTVRLLLPVGRPDPEDGARATLPSEPQRDSRHALRVLLVDDEDLVRRGTARLLTRIGHEVTEARDGYDAVRKYRDASPRPDVVILDLHMPVLDGADTFLLLRGIDPEVRVVLVSGLWERAVEQRLRNEGALAFLEKPFQPEILIDTLTRIAALPARTS